MWCNKLASSALLIITALLVMKQPLAQSAPDDSSPNPYSSIAQASEDLPDNFQQLVTMRKSLLNEQTSLNARLDRIYEEMRTLGSIEYWENEKSTAALNVNDNKVQLNILNDKAILTEEETNNLADIKWYIANDERIIKDADNNIQKFAKLKIDLATVESRLTDRVNKVEAVELKLGNLFNLEKERNSFRMMTSIAFVILVAIVIIGFYIIALKKEQIAESIFAGEKGIQFVTIFLIVISIILFGIMGVLESKELSALLGGLSGYILGRVSNNTPTSSKSETVEST